MVVIQCHLHHSKRTFIWTICTWNFKEMWKQFHILQLCLREDRHERVSIPHVSFKTAWTLHYLVESFYCGHSLIVVASSTRVDFGGRNCGRFAHAFLLSQTFIVWQPERSSDFSYLGECAQVIASSEFLEGQMNEGHHVRQLKFLGFLFGYIQDTQSFGLGTCCIQHFFLKLLCKTQGKIW